MRTLALIALLWTVFGGAAPARDFAGVVFPVGIYGDDTRTATCVTGPPGAVFEQTAWVHVPEDLGLAYLTLRFEFSANLDLTRRPEFHDLVSDVVFTDFTDGTVEWNMIFVDCPVGWIRAFSQECVLLDGQPSIIGLLDDRCLVRDCGFVLSGVRVVNELSVNDPGCNVVSGPDVSWGCLKGMYR